jgi:hypothetical protein
MQVQESSKVTGLESPSSEMSAEIVKQIYCPNCGNQLQLLKDDFTVTIDNERGEWSCDPAIVCSWEGCGVEFFVTFSSITYYK